MKLENLTITDFLEKTASSNPVPGGGSVAALSGALASSLSEMVANSTFGKKGYTEVEDQMQKIVKKAADYRVRLSQYIDKDSDAYKQVMSAYRLPKVTQEEIKRREQAIQEALKHASMVPLSVAKDAFAVMDLAGAVIDDGNKAAVTDGIVAAMMARTAGLSALYNVKINLNQIKDRSFIEEISKQVNYFEVEIVRKEKKILSKVIERFIS
jgi:formiminotetrahydrofolate cyclodeaminase